MLEDSDDVIILQHTWSLANSAIQLEFIELLQSDITPPAVNAPYSAALRIWCRLREPQQQSLLNWFKIQLANAEPLPLGVNNGNPLASTALLADVAGFVAVSTIWKSRFHSYQAFTKWLNGTSATQVRRRSPNRRRLEIYLPDWVGFWARCDQDSLSSTKAG